jgi:hypothetical protein
MRFSSLFRSRWLALFWSVGIVWTAVDVSGAFDKSDDGSASNGSANDSGADVKQVQDLVTKLKSG